MAHAIAEGGDRSSRIGGCEAREIHDRVEGSSREGQGEALRGAIDTDPLDSRAERINETSQFRISFDGALTDTNRLLRGVIDMGVPIAGFTEERRHLNEAFMDLTRGGID